MTIVPIKNIYFGFFFALVNNVQYTQAFMYAYESTSKKHWPQPVWSCVQLSTESPSFAIHSFSTKTRTEDRPNISAIRWMLLTTYRLTFEGVGSAGYRPAKHFLLV